MDIYRYVKPLGKINDDTELRRKFIAIYDEKTHKVMASFCLLYGKYLIKRTGFEFSALIHQSFEAIEKWINHKVNYHKARNIAFELNALAKSENDDTKARFYRTLAQLSAVPHVKYHALWATDFAITLFNRTPPGNMELVKKERLHQINLLLSMQEESQ